MPYNGERGSKTTQAGLLSDLVVHQALGEYDLVTAPEQETLDEIARHTKSLDELPAALSGIDIRVALAIDGSQQQTWVGDQQTMCFVRVGIASIDFDACRVLGTPVDPVAEHMTVLASHFNYALPGRSMTMGGRDPLGTWRLSCNLMFQRCGFSDDAFGHGLIDNEDALSLSLADAYLLLFGDPDDPATTIPVRKCPACGSDGGDDRLEVGRDGGWCPACGGELLLIDSLGLDEVFVDSGRENALNAVMSVAERLTMVAAIETLRCRNPEALGQVLFVADGPLAAIGAIQRLAPALMGYLSVVATELDAAGLPPLLIVGVEKGGNFAGHGQEVAPLIPRGHVMKLTHEYISKRITGRSGSRPYGLGHMYGRRFFYRRHDGGLLTVTVPPIAGLHPWATDGAAESWVSYPTLRPILQMLDEFRVARYENAVLPLVKAHEVASIVLSSSSALASLTQQSLGLVRNSRVARVSAFHSARR